MGNVLRSLYNHCTKPSAAGDSDYLVNHGVSPNVAALTHDLLNFEITSQVPAGLSNHVVSSKKAQANWYRKLSVAWREANPPPNFPQEASRLVVQILKGHKKADVEGLLAFYSLPHPDAHVEVNSQVPNSLPQGVKFQLQTLPIDPKSVSDGDTINVFVSTFDPRESSSVPQAVHMAAVERAAARSVRDYNRADALHKTIVDAGYRVITLQNNEDVLAKKYRIRLRSEHIRGIDAPESAMPHGKEAKEELLKLVQGKCLTVLAYDQDQYGRCVGDVYCNGIFIQEVMLKKGMVWHYTAYDKRLELAQWEKEARQKRVGLWAASNPEEPWEWRKDRRHGR